MAEPPADEGSVVAANPGPPGDTARSRGGGRMPRMPVWLPRAMLLAFGLLALYQLGSWAVHRLLGLLVVILVAFFVSLAMEPAVDALTARRMPRGVATAAVFVTLAAALVAFGAALGTLLVETIDDVAGETPRLAGETVDWLNRTFHQDFTVTQLRDRLLRDSDVVSGYAERAANHAWGLSNTVLGGIFRILLIALFSIYFTAYGPRMRRSICSLLPPARHDAVLSAWDLAIEKTGGYLYSRALLAVISAVAHAVFLALLDIPDAVALGIWFGVIASFVPTFGTYIAGVLPVLVALTVQPIDALWIVIFVVVYQLLQDYILQPRITARTVDVNPAVALLAVLGGAALLGAVGALLAIPVTATVQAFLNLYLRRYDVDDPRVDRVGAATTEPTAPVDTDVRDT